MSSLTVKTDRITPQDTLPATLFPRVLGAGVSAADATEAIASAETRVNANFMTVFNSRSSFYIVYEVYSSALAEGVGREKTHIYIRQEEIGSPVEVED